MRLGSAPKKPRNALPLQGWGREPSLMGLLGDPATMKTIRNVQRFLSQAGLSNISKCNSFEDFLLRLNLSSLDLGDDKKLCDDRLQ